MAATRTRSSFGRDEGLQVRMLLTMFLLGLVYVVFIGRPLRGRRPAPW